LRILFLSPRQCWPPVTGAKLREYHFARALGRRTQLTYVFFSGPALEVPGPAELPFCHRIVAVPPPRAYSLGQLARGLLGRWPLPVVNYTSQAMKQTLDGVLRDGTFDLVHLDSIHMAGYQRILERALPHARIIYNWHNIESELMGRYSAQERSASKKIYASITARRLRTAEDRILRTAHGHIVCSEREQGQLLRRIPEARIEVVGNGVDIAYYGGSSVQPATRNRIVFVGSMDYHANVDAAVWFSHEIWPHVRARFPEWRLTLVGTNPTAAVSALQAQPGIEVTGTVPDVRPYYQEAVAAVVPLRHGGGTRLKILEGMAAGIPVVSTALGAEGLEVSPGRNMLAAETREDWIEALASLSDRGPRWHELAAAGRTLVESRYDWDVLGQKLYETYRAWDAAPDATQTKLG
jgi:sugar transferase (PEP-CTERM/EpsH1 system associated)